ncbi:MAG TPA: hypothetical protein PKC33_10680, partial [Pseudomonadales bacterium]|nr:hypothetical protein [Pseudomonadales bacterium]HNH71942.1 hypothetical protein [Pseudomonadales bacterium]
NQFFTNKKQKIICFLFVKNGSRMAASKPKGAAKSMRTQSSRYLPRSPGTANGTLPNRHQESRP